MLASYQWPISKLFLDTFLHSLVGCCLLKTGCSDTCAFLRSSCKPARKALFTDNLLCCSTTSRFQRKPNQNPKLRNKVNAMLAVGFIGVANLFNRHHADFEDIALEEQLKTQV